MMANMLQDVVILDLSRAEQGPLASVWLADMGARVIKVEPPEGEIVRPNVTAFTAHNRGKEAVTADLRTPEGREFLDRLVKRADALVHNFTLPVAEKLGVDAERLREVNPRLVYVWASGFGAFGPRRDAPAFDLVAQAASGLVAVNGEEGTTPVPAGAAIADAAGAMVVAQAVLLGLYRRERFDVGSDITTSLLGTGLALQSWEVLSAGLAGANPPRAGNGHPQMGLYGVFETKDGHIALAGLGDARWPTFVSLLGLEDVAQDPRFITGNDRKANRAEITEAVRPAIRRHTTAELIEMFKDADIVFSPVQSYQDALVDEQAWANQYLQRIPQGDLGEIAVVGTPMTVDGEPLPARGPAPELGQNTELVMAELGYSWEEISRVREAGGI